VLPNDHLLRFVAFINMSAPVVLADPVAKGVTPAGNFVLLSIAKRRHSASRVS
jgi:hypothetical protein